MRYILDDNGYVEEVVFGGTMSCNNKGCTEYTGSIPEGYTSLEEWVDNANIRAYTITDGNLVYDSTRDAELQATWETESTNNSYEIVGNKTVTVDSGSTNIQYASAKAVYNSTRALTNLELEELLKSYF